MNYRHAYHAGNFADVLKHAVLVLLLEHLRLKPGPFCVLDTHAGRGCYDLLATAARKTTEHLQGIGRILAASGRPPELAGYVGIVQGCNAGAALQCYPGSPAIVQRLLRPGDRLVAIELHPEDGAALANRYAADPQVAVHRMDGWHGLKAFLPPRERRGLVLIDPPFEAPGELERLAAGLRQAARRWAQGLLLAWYPIKERTPSARFLDAVAESGMRKIIGIELRVRQAQPADRLVGCGLLLVNPPWTIEGKLERLLPWLADRLAQGAGAAAGWRWLVPE